jgi:hypothetical protein
MNQTAAVDASTKKLVSASVRPVAMKTESEWLPWDPSAANIVDPQIDGVSIPKAMFYLGLILQCNTKWRNMFTQMPNGKLPVAAQCDDTACVYVRDPWGTSYLGIDVASQLSPCHL